MRPSKIGVVVIRILLVILALEFSVILCEFVILKDYRRVYANGPWELGYIFTPDDRLIYGMKRDSNETYWTPEFEEHAETDAFGFRGRDNDEFVKPSDTYRIVAIGDSFTYGHGLSEGETYPDRLKEYVTPKGKYTGYSTEVLNMAVPGYTPDQEYRTIMERIPLASTDTIVWNINAYDLSDLTGPMPALYGINRKNQLVSFDGRHNWMYIRNYLYENLPPVIRDSKIGDLVMSKISAVRWLWRKPDLPEREMNIWARQKMLLELESVGRLTKNLHIRLVIVRLPVHAEFESGSAAMTKQFDDYFGELGGQLKKDGIEFLDMKKEIDRLATESSDMIQEEIPMLDAAGVQSLKKQGLMFYAGDGHPNVEGAKVFAGIAAEYLMENEKP